MAKNEGRLASICSKRTNIGLWVELWVGHTRQDGIHIRRGFPADICLTLSPPVKLLRRSRWLSGNLANPCRAGEAGVSIFLFPFALPDIRTLSRG